MTAYGACGRLAPDRGTANQFRAGRKFEDELWVTIVRARQYYVRSWVDRGKFRPRGLLAWLAFRHCPTQRTAAWS